MREYTMSRTIPLTRESSVIAPTRVVWRTRLNANPSCGRPSRRLHYSGKVKYGADLRGPRRRVRALTIERALRRLRGLSSGPAGPSWSLVLANTKSAEKAARQAVKRRANNVAARSKLRSAIRNVTVAIGSGDKAEAEGSYKAAVPVIDSMVNKRLIHKNKAARHKSRLVHRIRAMA
jgi:small subunit ribosomal protein S20